MYFKAVNKRTYSALNILADDRKRAADLLQLQASNQLSANRKEEVFSTKINEIVTDITLDDDESYSDSKLIESFNVRS